LSGCGDLPQEAYEDKGYIFHAAYYTGLEQKRGVALVSVPIVLTAMSDLLTRDETWQTFCVNRYWVGWAI
jgi:hypothetical protein